MAMTTSLGSITVPQRIKKREARFLGRASRSGAHAPTPDFVSSARGCRLVEARDWVQVAEERETAVLRGRRRAHEPRQQRLVGQVVGAVAEALVQRVVA